MPSSIHASLAVALVVLAGCGQPEPQSLSDHEIAVVDGRVLSRERFETELKRREARGVRIDPREALQDLVQRERLLARALQLRLDQEDEVRRAYESLLIARLKEREFESRLRHDPAPLAGAVDPGPGSALRVPRDVPSGRTGNPDVQVRLAVLRQEATPPLRGERLRRLETRMAEIRQKALTLPVDVPGFGALAAEFSDDVATRLRGGDMGWTSTDPARSNLDPAVLAAGAALATPGDLSDPVLGTDGFYLVKLIDRRERRAAAPEWDENLARHQATLQRRQAFEAEFQAEIERRVPTLINTNALARIAASREARALGPPQP